MADHFVFRLEKDETLNFYTKVGISKFISHFALNLRWLITVVIRNYFFREWSNKTELLAYKISIGLT